MTKISYIHGINQQATAEERRQRGRNVPDQNYINYSGLTEGELELALLAEQANILTGFYPDVPALQQQKNLIRNTLYKGVHGLGATSWGQLTPDLQRIARGIKDAARKTRPANGKMIVGRKTNRIGGPADPLVPMVDCNAIMATAEPGSAQYGALFEQYKACLQDNKYRPLLNKYLEKSAHHLLYEFVPGNQLNSIPNVAAVKAVQHQIGKAVIHKITKLSKNNLRLWMRNGVLRSNAKQGTGALQPEETIEVLRKNPDHPGVQAAGISLDPVTVTLILGLVSILVTAAVEAAKMKKGMSTENQQLQEWQQIQGFGTTFWGPDPPDWYTQGGTQPPPAGNGAAGLDIESALPLILGGGAAILLLS